MANHIDLIAAQGAAVLLLDNTGWSETDRSRGASGKWDMVELVYKITATDFGPDKAGTITLDRVRSRDGDEARQLVAQVGDGTYSTIHQAERSEQDAALTQAIIEHLEEHPGATTEEIAKSIRKRQSRVRDGCSDLEAHGTATQQPSETRDGRGVPHTRKGWYLAPQSQTAAVPNNGTGTDGHYPAASGRPESPALKLGRGLQPSPNSPDADTELDRLTAKGLTT